MIVDQPRPKPNELYARSYAAKAAEGFLDTAVHGVNQTRRRIIKKYPSLEVGRLFGANRHHVNKYRIWITDQPEEIYPVKPLYHVTGSIVVDKLLDKEKVKPSMNLWEFQSQNHRGIGNYLRSAIPTIFGIDLAEKDSFVWTGSNVDNEGLTLEHQRGQSDHQDIETLLGLMFKKEGTRFTGLTSEFEHLVTQVKTQNQDNLTESEREYIDQFLKLVFPATVIREGWFSQLKGILLREISPDSHVYDTELVELTVMEHINRTMNYYKRATPSQGVILELNPEAMFAGILKYAPYPFIPGRDPEEIVPIPFFDIQAVRRVYAIDPVAMSLQTINQLEQNGIELMSTAEFPSDHLLDPTKPAYLKGALIDAENPLCRRRYLGDRQAKWRDRLQSGLMAPYYNMRLTEKQIAALDDLFGDQLFADKAISKRFPSVRRRVELQLEKTILPGVLESYFHP